MHTTPVRSIIYHKKQNLKIQYACIAYFALIIKKNCIWNGMECLVIESDPPPLGTNLSLI